MKAVPKRRGSVYRVSLATVTALAVVVGVLWVASFIWHITGGVHLSSSSGASMVAMQGSVNISYSPTYNVLNAGLVPLNQIRQKYRMVGLDIIKTHWWKYRWRKRPDTPHWELEFPLWHPLVLLSIWPVVVVSKKIQTRPRHE